MSAPHIPYAEIGVTTNFSFLRGASRPEELAAAASLHRLHALGIADRNTLAGTVRVYRVFNELEPEQWKPKLLVGARLCFTDDTPEILAYPRDKEAYGRLCRLLTEGNLRGEKGECLLTLHDLLEHRYGLSLAVIPPRQPDEKFMALLERLHNSSDGNVWLLASMLYRGHDRRRLARLQETARRALTPLIASNDVLYHAYERRTLQDVVSCIREKMTIEKAGRILESNAERHLKNGLEMARLFRDAPEAVAETKRFADRIGFSFDQLRYIYPDEPVPPGMTPQRYLESLVWKGIRKRYRGFKPPRVRKLLHKELRLIRQLDYANYFITVHDIVVFANSQGILCQGRGSAANSAICYVLGVTAVDPLLIKVLLARFLSKERKEPPDIDIDFEHERREEVIQWIYERYGERRAAITATVIHYRPRSAIRDVGKVLGLTEDVTAALANTVWGSWGSGIPEEHIRQAGLDPDNREIARAAALATELLGFPRHLSQHVGGFVLIKDRLDEHVPIGNAAMEKRRFIEWDKDDIDELGMMKVDVLALGMLTCIRKALDLLRRHKRIDYDLAQIPKEDAAVYEMLSRGDSLGVFQVESRAQMNMLPRMRPKEFYDLVIEVAIVRPGPIQGDMVHPYLKRRNGIEEVKFPSPSPDHGDVNELHEILGRTKGVPLFQEQAMELAITAAKFSPDEANGLRKAMATFRNDGTMWKYKEKFINRMIARGYDRDFVERCYKQIEGFGSYGFPESHAVSFALLVYASSWLKCHHPEAFCCAILNSQPMGFYTRASLVRDAREHGAEVREIDVNFSEQDNILEPSGEKFAVRLGFRNIDGFQDKWEEKIVQRRAGGFPSLESFAQRTQLPKKAILLLADADCFRSIGLDRRAALWSARRLPNDDALPLFAALNEDEHPREEIKPLPVMPLPEHVVADYQTAGLSLKGHPMEFLREIFSRERVYSCRAATNAKNGSRLRCAGAVLVRQRPGTAKGVVFMTIEDETGIANIVIWQNVFERYRKEIMGARLVLIEGRIQRADGVTHLVAERLEDRSAELHRLSEWKVEVPLARTDEVSRPQQDHRSPRHPRNVRILPRSRDFH
ncbi:MAG: error-prone DNA polymerase [Xanthobacteraceae bacterium]|nr:error-prone DNA polymerase [Xanthobacteraceae bacterium]